MAMSMPVTTGGAPGGPNCHRKRPTSWFTSAGPAARKTNPGAPFEEAFDLSIEGIATYDLFVCFEKRTVFRVDCVDCNLAARGIREPFLLYLGRIDPNKGCETLLQHFMRFTREHDIGMQLVMAGPANMPLPEHAGIVYPGFVEELS